jgi:hypothetical protein
VLTEKNFNIFGSINIFLSVFFVHLQTFTFLYFQIFPVSCLQPGQKTDKQDVREELDKSKAEDDENNDIGDNTMCL